MLDSIDKPIVVSVIGPANHGKTSVLRTLSEDSKFGDVGDKAGTTTEVRSKSIVYCNMDVMRLCDTPGFQISQYIGDSLNNGARGNLLDDIINAARRIEEEGTAVQGRICPACGNGWQERQGVAEHDRKAWEQVSRSDVLLLVLDVTQLPDKGFDDDLHLLSRCGKPTVVLLNFDPQSDSHVQSWKDRLNGYNFHLVTEYNADHRRAENEQELFDLLAKVLPDKKHVGIALMLKQSRKTQAQERLQLARRRIAQLAVDVMRCEVSRLEAAAWESLCGIWKFDRTETLDNRDSSASGESAFDSSERDHWFGDKVTRHFGTGTAAGAATGASLGAAIDLASAGHTLGAGTAVSALVGATLGSLGGGIFNHRYDNRQKRITVRVTPHLGRIVISRAAFIAKELSHRGRACEGRLRVPPDPQDVATLEIKALLKSVRKKAKPGDGEVTDLERTAVTDLEKLLGPIIP